jgi:hypothetical protein
VLQYIPKRHGIIRVPTALTSKSSSGRVAARSWLGCAVNDQVERIIGLEETGKPGAIANIQVVLAKMTCPSAQPFKVPPRVPFRTEEIGPHVVIYPDHTLRAAVEEGDKLRTDKSTGTGDKYFHG